MKDTMMEYARPQGPAYRHFFLSGNSTYLKHYKRFFDVVLALILLPIAAPLIGVLWFFAQLDGWHGFYGHDRIGADGRPFKCWKIRSMKPNADAMLQDHLASNPLAAAEWARDHKLRNDPRVTFFGKFIRATSLDELPQIWNVLIGEMSFVGPRPIVQSELEKYGRDRWAYFSAKPGITGAWQVSGRNDVSYDDRVRYDVDYLYRLSFARDCLIILKTGFAVLARTGR